MPHFTCTYCDARSYLSRDLIYGRGLVCDACTDRERVLSRRQAARLEAWLLALLVPAAFAVSLLGWWILATILRGR